MDHGWMDGWMDGWREGGREGGRDGWMDGGREGGWVNEMKTDEKPFVFQMYSILDKLMVHNFDRHISWFLKGIDNFY